MRIWEGLAILLVLCLRQTIGRAYNDVIQDCPSTVNEFMKHSYRVPLGVPNRALKTVPPEFYISQSSIPGAGLGAFSKTFMPRHTWLGEAEGVIKPYTFEESQDTGQDDHDWVIHGGEDGVMELVINSAFNEHTSNWLRYLNSARNISQLNVWPVFCYHTVYYITTRHIYPSQELLTYYGEEFAQSLRIDYTKFPKFN